MKNKIIKLLVKLRIIKDPKSKEKRHALVGSAKRWKIKQDFQIKFLKDQGLERQDVFLDIGCGTLRGGIPIIKFLDNRNYYGIDIRKEVLKEAKKELTEENIEHKIGGLMLFSEFDNLKLETKFDTILAFSVLIHMTDEILSDCLKFVSQNLKDKGKFYANVNVGDKNDGNWLEFPVKFKTLDFYKEVGMKNSLNIEVIGTLSELGHVTDDKLSDQQIMLKFYKS